MLRWARGWGRWIVLRWCFDPQRCAALLRRGGDQHLAEMLVEIERTEAALVMVRHRIEIEQRRRASS